MAVLCESMLQQRSELTARFTALVRSAQDLNQGEPSSATMSSSDARQVSLVQLPSVTMLWSAQIH
jgi:hypothetical protein